MINALEREILKFDNWSQPWIFYKTVIENLDNRVSEIDLFIEIWNKASDINLWNYSDLAIGCKTSQIFIKEYYKLKDEVSAKIVKAISYEWK